eukprot:7683893-Karenia_brevis.AAC.1
MGLGRACHHRPRQRDAPSSRTWCTVTTRSTVSEGAPPQAQVGLGQGLPSQAQECDVPSSQTWCTVTTRST